LPLLLAVLAGVVMSNEPGEAFENLMDAFYEGDAEGVEAGLSSNSIDLINMILMMVKIQPAQAAVELSQEFQIALTGEELVNWTATDFIDALINAPRVTDGFPPKEDIEVSGYDIQGDTSTVFLIVSNYPEEIEIAMIYEGNDWKLDESMVQTEL
jgi:hypothetical protein